ncbi:hypothetical protein HNR23_003476 [Nocardiopsis mwathae]|uniref:Uncharacterized protein n=1 Tax=Nocardiopsis mwathae TaxID=1472723 RepID=A0A7W9YKW5_9ACTN|nr:hypothetical protein [Nocardiopsis mwathae]MBB6173416.1 hypothetical protein [Nocardiopsis mwathae]
MPPRQLRQPPDPASPAASRPATPRPRPYAALRPATAPDRARLPGPSPYATQPSYPARPTAPPARATRPKAPVGPRPATRPSGQWATRQPTRPRPASTVRPTSQARRRAYYTYKHRVLSETAGQTRALFTLYEQLPYSCTILALMLLSHALGLLP